MSTLNEVVKEAHELAKSKGWWDKPRETPELLMLMVSEISEALEAYRNGEPCCHIVDGKPEGEATELADCVIRICDYFGHKGWDLDSVVRLKLHYNKTRPHRHGNKVC